jgi:hypothetical protein
VVLYLVIICRVVLASTFTLAVVGKLLGQGRLKAFAAWLGTARLVPAGTELSVAVGVVAVEVGLVGLVSFAPTASLGMACSAGVLVAFTAVLLRLRRQGASCRCFGASRAVVGVRQVARNLALLLVCGVGVVGSRFASTTVARPEGVALAITAGVVVVLAVMLLDEFIATHAVAPAASRTSRRA